MRTTRNSKIAGNSVKILIKQMKKFLSPVSVFIVRKKDVSLAIGKQLEI